MISGDPGVWFSGDFLLHAIVIEETHGNNHLSAQVNGAGPNPSPEANYPVFKSPDFTSVFFYH